MLRRIEDDTGGDVDAGAYPPAFFRGLTVAIVASAPLWAVLFRAVR
jgi:hypothetical protein